MSSARRPRRFSHRVFKLFALCLLAVSAIFTGYFLHFEKQRMEDELVDRGLTLAALLASGAKTAAFSENAALVQDTLQGVVERPEVLSAAVYTEGRDLVAAEGKSPALRERARNPTAADIAVLGDPLLRTQCLNLQEAGHADFFCPVLLRTRAASGRDLHFESPAAATGDELVGYVQLTLDREPQRRALAALLRRSLLLALLMLLISTGAAFVLARRVTEPLARLTEAVRAFGAGGIVPELPRSSGDEIDRLAEAFTTMTNDLAERDREQQRLAGRLQEARKLEAVGSLSQGISHDFKNILSTLKGAVHILQKGSPDNEFVLKYTGRMQASLDRARDLVERLIAFSRSRRLQEVPVDLTALLERVAPALRDAVGEGVRLEVESPGEPVRVLGDAASLEQLLTNLAYNARDAMPEGGSLCVRLETVTGASGAGSGTARVTVRDTGTGMDAEVRRRLFEPFYTTKDAGAGLGLGLSIVRGIVEQHHGRIEVESGPGEGTSFRVDLPLLGAEAVRER